MGVLTAKLVALAVVLVCVVIGAVGLLLPIIPGVLFLAIAAVVAARHSSTIERALRSSRKLGGHLDRANRLRDLDFATKIRLGALLSLRMLIEAVAFVISLATRLAKPRLGSSDSR